MKKSGQICCSMMATICLLGCANTLSAQAPNAQLLESEVIDAYRQAHDRRDLQAMGRLFCWDRVTPELKKVTEDGVKEMFEDKILSIRMTDEHPSGRMNQYIKNGLTYGLNLPVLRELVVETPSLPKAAPVSSYYPVGLKDGHYLISLMAPVPNTKAQTPANSAGPASQATEREAAPIGNAGPQPVVPAKTPLTVRLEHELGVKTVTGTFSAIFSRPVQVDGVTVIPAGATAQGVVTRTGEYSPQMTLTALIVNGKPHSVTTVAITFNEQISFPAGSEFTFHLVRPLKVAH